MCSPFTLRVHVARVSTRSSHNLGWGVGAMRCVMITDLSMALAEILQHYTVWPNVQQPLLVENVAHAEACDSLQNLEQEPPGSVINISLQGN